MINGGNAKSEWKLYLLNGGIVIPRESRILSDYWESNGITEATRQSLLNAAPEAVRIVLGASTTRSRCFSASPQNTGCYSEFRP